MFASSSARSRRSQGSRSTSTRRSSLSDILFGKLGLPTEGLKKTQSGAYSTAADVLEGLRGRHEIIDLILEQRQLTKLLGTYVDALPGLVNAAYRKGPHFV